jgi:hypothetical protein
MSEYNYFISFFHPKGFGSLVVTLNKQIENANEIEALQFNIANEQDCQTCVITNFILLNKKESQVCL